jgi:hypothetical protein
MPVMTNKHRSVLDFTSAAALVEALKQVEISDCNSLSSESPVRNSSTTEAADEELDGADWLLTNSLAEQPSAETEARRLVILKSYLVLDTDKEQAFDKLAATAGNHFQTSWASISLVDMGRLWFKSAWNHDDSALNLNLADVNRKDAFCAHTILQDDILEVRDTLLDSRFSQNPLVQQQPVVRFYAGVPLVTPEGVKIGAFCLMDNKPRPNGLSQSEKVKLYSLATETMQTMVQRRAASQSSRKRALQDASNATLLKASKADALPMPIHIPKMRRTGGDNITCDTVNTNIIQRPLALIKDALLPDPKTADVDPDEYLIQLVEALYGVSPKTKSALDLKDYFSETTEAQMAAYTMQVVAVTRENDVKKLQEFCEANGSASLDCFNRFGEGLLNMTCRRGFKETVRFLLSPPVSLNVRVRDDYGRTPLHDACWNAEPQLDICTWICEQDPSLFLVTDKRGYTPFQYARKGDWHVWRQFLFDRRDLLVGLMKPEVVCRFS